jgi:hypothetical protein
MTNLPVGTVGPLEPVAPIEPPTPVIFDEAVTMLQSSSEVTPLVTGNQRLNYQTQNQVGGLNA